MIDRVVQRPFVLWLADAIADADPKPPGAPLPEGVEGVTDKERRRVQTLLTVAVDEERARPATPPPARADDRRGEDAAPLEETCWFPRDPLLSLTQSALELYLEEHRADLLAPVADGTDDRRADDVPPPGADMRLLISDADIPGETEGDRRLAGAFEITDVRWASSVVAMGWRLFSKKHLFNNAPAPPHKLASDARVIVVGDWATGIRRAKNVAAEIRAVLDASDSQGRECHVIHLGDTYYAGWEYEYKKRLLPNWPVHRDEPHGSWSLNGNHDMYTGGHGYFGTLLEEQRFKPFHRGSSWFSLENDYWQLLGLDTSWDDHDLTGAQPTWIQRKLSERPDRKTMLLSHHQLFSAHGDGGPKLQRRLEDVLASERIDAWLWGHEHRCVVYEPTDHVRFGRCIGHGGVPVYVDRERKSPVRWHLDKWFTKGVEDWAFMGFAVLDFDGPSIGVRYVDEFGGDDYTETIV